MVQSRIESIRNAQVRYAYSLRQPKHFRESSDFFVEGFHWVQEALRDAERIRFIFSTPHVLESPEGKELHENARRRDVCWLLVSPKVMLYLSDTVTPQNLAAVIAKPDLPPHRSQAALALYGLQDPGNVGTLIRSAEAAGAGVVVIVEGCCDPFHPKAARASMGSLLRVPIRRFATWQEANRWLRGEGFIPVALDREGNAAWREVFRRSTVFWIGAEGSGLPDELKRDCDSVLKIPLAGRVESLNAAVAGSLALFSPVFQSFFSGKTSAGAP